MLIARVALVAGVATCVLASPSSAQTDEHQKTLADMPAGLYKSDNNHTHIYFTYSHVGFSNAHGRFDKFNGQLNFVPQAPATSSVSFTIDPASIDTNIPELEAILKGSGFFDVSKSPEMTFASHGLSRLNQNEGVLTGDLTMHGITRPVVLKVKLNKFLVDKELKFCRFGFTATGVVKRSDWGLGAVPLVSDDVSLDLDVEFTKSVA